MNSDFVTFKLPGYGKGYGGPWLPDAANRYVITLYALKTEKIDIPESADISIFAKAVLPFTILTTTFFWKCFWLTHGPLNFKANEMDSPFKK